MSTTDDLREALVVVGVDGSRHGREAFRWALREARLHGARIRAVHAWTIPPLTLPGSTPATFEHVSEELASSAAQVLHDAAELAGDAAADVGVEQVVVKGQAAEALLRASAEADLLVVGSRGHRPLAGTLLGSVSQQCLHHAACPIAIVHAAHHGDRRRIVVGVDGSVGARAALEWAAHEARRLGTSLHAVCAYNEPPTVAAGGPAAAGALAELRHGLERDAERVLADAEELVDIVPVSTRAVHGPAADVLLEAASDADLLVVGSRGRGGFASLVLGSVSQQCAARAPGVVVVVPAGLTAA
jgi:nucleotide-binding universal stress UspA family protein